MFVERHIGPNDTEQTNMLQALGYTNLDDFINHALPSTIHGSKFDNNFAAKNESEAVQYLKTLLRKNHNFKNYIGMGFHDTILPAVIQRNVLENPGWYTAYTPYQAEISQGRLETLLNFQQLITDLTGLDIANASLLDEASAAAEAVLMSSRLNDTLKHYFVDENVFPYVLNVINTRASYYDIKLEVGNIQNINPEKYCGIFIQNPNKYGEFIDYTQLIQEYKQKNPQLKVTMSCDILSLILFISPSMQGADIAVGNTQRFGVSLGFGGPAAAYIACKNEYKRTIPGRIIGVSKDKYGKKVLRMALQTREQHIRREKATSNICTSQVLLANIATFYAIYHGYTGLYNIATTIHQLSSLLRDNLMKHNISILKHNLIFDTIVINDSRHQIFYDKLLASGYLVGYTNGLLYISISEKTTLHDVENIFNCCVPDQSFNGTLHFNPTPYNKIYRTDQILQHYIFNKYHSETAMLRYLKHLENKDISLVHSMIPLGSCTMKLNPTSAMLPLSWNEIANTHPFTPTQFCSGYIEMIQQLKQYLLWVTGFSDISFQPNSGAQGEYAGLLAIRKYFANAKQTRRNKCLIPRSAHGTNPATASIIGFEVIAIACDEQGNIDVNDLEKQALLHADSLACLMVTYPSTHGVYETQIKTICNIIHNHGGQVYMDGANLNALVGLVKPADLGADVLHINLHKTFAIPHGGGGPGMGPIGVKQHLVDFLPKYDFTKFQEQNYSVSSAEFGSGSILSISWMYITMLGTHGLTQSSKVAILNANYIAYKLHPYFPILFRSSNNLVAHECILDIRTIKKECGITEVDIAKRLMDYGFHAPTMSFPVPGTLMVEPTESESLEELDRFIQTMINIYNEIQDIKTKRADALNNPLKNAPHTIEDLTKWQYPYSIEVGCFPSAYVKTHKVFPTTNRVDDSYGDRNFICSCDDFYQN